jgi:CMP-N-acetylneuraminic acid synthetase
MIEAALWAKHLDRIIVSTDDLEIKDIALGFGAEVPFLRPKSISWDCPSEFVTQHAVKYFEDLEYEIEIAVTMQPTTPFVSPDDISGCVSLLKRNAFNSVFTGRIVRERPEWMFYVNEETRRAKLVSGVPIKGLRGVTQSLPTLVVPNGAVYATERDTLMRDGVIIAENTGVWLMPPEKSVDIDEPIDFQFAEFLLEKGLV